MKKFLLLLTLLCTLFTSVKATEVEIGVGDASVTTATYIPINALWKYGWSQQIYTAEEIGMAGTINSITFWMYHTGSNPPSYDINVYMAGVTDEVFATTSSWVSLSASDLVFSGTTFANLPTSAANIAEFTITFDTPFAYDGSSNLLIAFANNTGSYVSGMNARVFGSTSGPKMCLYKYQDSGAIDPTTPGVEGTLYGLRNVIKLDITAAGGGVTCDKPEAVEANDVTANSATINWIGTAAAYNLQYKASADADWTLVKNLSTTSYQLTGLVSNTAYQVQVQSICGENTSGWKSASFTTLISLPYAEHFNGTSAPSGWTIWSGQLQADGSATRSSSSVWSFGSNNGVFDNHARANIYGTSCYRWLQTPAIPIPEMEEGDPGFQMYFNLALTKYSGTLVEVVKGSQSDDRFVVLVSIDEGANWTILREWNNSGSEYVYDDIATAGEEVAPIDLSAYAGQTILLAFYGESTVSGGDNNIHVDDVIVENIPTCLKPTDLHALDAQATSSTLPVAWTANSGETAWRLQYKPTADAEAEWITLDIAANPYTITGLAAFTEYEIRVAAVCTEEDFTDYGKSIIAKTAAVVPFLQTFVTTSMPVEWKRYEALLEAVQQSGAQLEATENGWNVGAKNGVFNNEHLYLNIAGTDTKYWLVSPVIEMLDGYQLTFDLALTTATGSTPTAVTAGNQNDDQFIVFITTDGGANWTALGTWDNGGAGVSFDQISTEGQTVKFDLSSYAGQSIMLAFYGESTVAGGDNNLHISNVAIDLIPACERPLSITLGNVTGTTAEVTWDADEDGTWEYGYVANPAADFAPAETDYTGSTTEKIADLTELTETTDYVFFVRHACSETEKSEPLMKTFKTLQTPAELPYVGDFEESNGWLLFNGELTNKWVRGTAVHNGEGTYALYVSNDNGVSAAYTNNSECVVYATKTFYFPEAGMYSFSFDWMCNGESSYDYIRVALVPASVEVEAATALPTGLGTTSLPEGWIALDGGSKLNLSSVWQTQRVELNVEQLGYYKVIIVWRDDTSSGSDPAGAIDNFKISKLSCRMPNGLTLGDVTANSAAFSWNDDEDGMTWVYACVPAGQEPTEYTEVNENSVLVEGLTESTAYDFYLRKHCGENEESEPVMISFQTKQMPAEVGNLFTDDFEDGNHWLFINGTIENAWAYGEAAHNGEGTHALYISNDGGTTNAYTINKETAVFATKLLHLQKGAYTFQYDWRAVGEGTSTLWDYLRVALVPEDAEFVAGTTLPTGVTYQALPAGCVALDGGKGLNQKSDWQTFTTDAINVEDGNYMVVLMWRNDTGTGTQTPAAVDNFSISRIVCATPANFGVTENSATTTSVELTWTPMSDETNWVVRYKEQGAEEWLAVVPVANNTFLLEGLNPATNYEAQVATQCDPEDATAIGTYSASILFATKCLVADAIDENFDGITGSTSTHVLPICWQSINTTTYSSYEYYPTVYASASYANSGVNSLKFYSYYTYSYYTNYDPQDQYAILPEIENLNTLRIKLNARKYSASYDATFTVGVMSIPTDTTTFVPVATLAPSADAYEPFVVPFDSYTGTGKYIAIKMQAADIVSSGSSYRGVHIDDIVVEEIPSCIDPKDLVAVADSMTTTSAVLAWTPQGTETNWLVRYRQQGAEEWNEPILATKDSLKIEGLLPYTSYNAQVAAWCDPNNAEAVSPYSAAITFKTLPGIPYLETFGASKPSDWSLYTGWMDSIAIGHAELVSATTGWNFGSNNGVFDDHARANIFGTTCNKWLVTPAIEMQANVQLTFNLALTKFSGTLTPIVAGSQADDRFVVFIANEDGSNWSVLRRWDNEGSEYVYDDIATAGQEIKIVLDDSYAGQKIRLAFYGESHLSGGDNNLHIDNVKLDFIPDCERPMSLTVSEITAHTAVLNWESDATAWQICLSGDEANLIDVTEKPYTLTGLVADSAYTVKVRTNCGGAESEWTNAVNMHTAVACPAPTALKAELTEGNGTIATLKWKAGAEETAWILEYSLSEDMSDLIAVEVADTVYNLQGLTAEATYYARVKADCGEIEGESVYSAIISFKPTNAVTLTINNGTTTNSYLPFYGFYVDHLTHGQFIVPADSLAAIQWGTIDKLTFYLTTPASKDFGNARFEAYIAEAPATTMSAMTAWSDMDKVMNAKALVIDDYKMVVTLDAPYQYQGGNLLIGLDQTATGGYATTTWLGVTANGASMSCYDEGTPTQRNFLPKMTIGYLPGSAPACLFVSNLQVTATTATSATFSWTAEEGQNAWQLVYSTDPAFDPNEATPVEVASNPFALGELTAETSYTVYVRANCGEDGFSAWSKAVTFTTASNCQLPDALDAADITTNSASISWNGYGQTGFNLRYSTDGENWTVANGVESPYSLTSLEDATDYYVQVQVTCDVDNWSETLHFVTKQAPATIPYANDFETKNGWAFINGTFANAWAYGEAAHNGEGTHALYISNNGGAANAYNASPYTVVYATKLFNFEAGSYAFKYDWKCYGEGTSTLWDYLRVVLVPNTVELEAASDLPSGVTATALPAGWIALDGGKGLNQKNTWQTFNSDDIAVEAGLYKVVLIWRNDNSTANNPAAAIDNFSIKKLTCLKPTNLTTSDVYAHSAKLSWSAGEEGQSAWQIALDTIAAFDPDTLSNLIDVNDTSYIFSDLLASHTYYAYVRANCGEDGASDWSAIKSFRTTIACPAPTGLEAQLTPGNGSIATLTWNAGEAQAWQVEYSLNSDMSNATTLVVTEPVAELTGLTAEATYYACVKADCGELDGESTYSAIISFLPTDIYSIVVNDGTQTNSYVPIYGSYVDEGNTASQFIVPAESLQEILWDSITELTFYASTATANWGAAEFEIYMTTTEDATLSALKDWDNLTQVMVAGNLSIQNNKMVVTLSEPFQYTGDNLLIGFKQTVAGSWVSCSWYGKNTTGASIGGYGTGNNMTQRNFLPKMTINYVPGQAPACMWATHLNVSNITAEGATIAWDAVEGANWEYALVMAGEEPVVFAAATNPMVLDNLFENTAYVFYLRNNCGEENSKLVLIAFSTTENIETIPYETQFADAATWKLVNSDNAWTFDGNLFISNDGVNYGYDEDQASVSYATKLFDFDVAGDYTFTYFWKAVGEYNDEDGAIDFLRVALVPAAVQLTAGVAPEGLTAENLPAGWMALDGGAALVATDVFTRQDAKINVPAGHYRVAFIWINDDSFTDGDPAAINCLYVKRGDATGIEAGAGIENQAIKFIRDDQVYILLNGTVYNVTGQKVEMK